jgi:hypothetical protein
MGCVGKSARVWKGMGMSEVLVTVELHTTVYQVLLAASNEAGVPVSDFAGGIVENYLGENYAEV